MRTLILGIFLLTSICAYHLKPTNILIDKVEFSNLPKKYNFDVGHFFEIEKILKNVTKTPIEPRAGTEAVLNDFADKVFANIQQFMVESGFDPLQLPDIHEEFHYTLIIEYHGELDLTSGWLSDVSTIHRGGDVLAAYSTQDKFLEITLPIAFDDLQFSFDFSAKLMGLGPVGWIDGKVTDIALTIKLGFDSTTLLLSLDSFNIDHTGTISIEFHGEPLIDWFLDLLADVATAVLEGVFVDVIEGFVRDALDGAIQSINDAIDGFLNPTTPVPTTTQVVQFFN